MDTCFQGLSALEVTQVVRCKQFAFLDVVLSQEILNPNEITVATEYLKAYLQFIRFYFKVLPHFYQDVVWGSLIYFKLVK